VSAEYTFFSNAHRTFIKAEPSLYHGTTVNTHKGIFADIKIIRFFKIGEKISGKS
jgi:hypothetical protein